MESFFFSLNFFSQTSGAPRGYHMCQNGQPVGCQEDSHQWIPMNMVKEMLSKYILTKNLLRSE